MNVRHAQDAPQHAYSCSAARRSCADALLAQGIAQLVLVVVVLSIGIASAQAQTAVPCVYAGGARHNCDFYVAGDGRTGGAPVQASDGSVVGYLHQGTNWVTCQRSGATVSRGVYHNRYWAFTVADDDRAGWVNAVYARGGSDDGPFGGVPDCATAHGEPPGVARLPPAPVVVPGGRPAFEAPWPCGQAREYFHHRGEVSFAIDFNIAGPKDLGTPVLASARGTVVLIRRVVPTRPKEGYGNEVVIDHGGGWSSRVAHLSRITVRLRQTVTRGQEIGKVGSTGHSDGPHLHYEQLLSGGHQPVMIGGSALRYSATPARISSRPCR